GAGRRCPGGAGAEGAEGPQDPPRPTRGGPPLARPGGLRSRLRRPAAQARGAALPAGPAGGDAAGGRSAGWQHGARGRGGWGVADGGWLTLLSVPCLSKKRRAAVWPPFG